MEITLPVRITSLYSPRVRRALDRSMSRSEDVTVIAVAETFEVVDGDAVEARYDPTAYYKTGAGNLVSRTLFGAPDDVIAQSANAYFTAFGCADLSAQIAGNLNMMANDHEGSEQFHVFLMPCGVIFATSTAAMVVLQEAQEKGVQAITRDFVSRHIRVVLDDTQSARAMDGVLPSVQSFLNEIFQIDVTICGILDGDPAGTLAQLDAVSFRLAA